ncbi:unnamed protein product [Rhizoctonia solani]|uniref:BTB domain-containing protein n=1 Tax=Rhizoctonia solani TaxID=456999 RepID=A0A8H3ATA2_9AGAM|nr:unnamed protein product [Rhizoctonia solani]CAE6469489.1 unnamed protein product [Rhizoctonia solani]
MDISNGTPGTTNNRRSLKDATKDEAESWETKTTSLRVHPGSQELPIVHDLTGANIKLRVDSVIIKAHEDRISKFVRLNKLIQEARNVDPQSDTLTITLPGDKKLAYDFLHTFELLNSWSIDKPGSFKLEILLSAAIISAAYDNPTLLAFCIKQLEGLPINSMERLDIARKLDIKSWRDSVNKELVNRDGSITKEEATILGIDAYWYVANVRENQSRDVERGLWVMLAVVCGLWMLSLVLACVFWS